MMISIDREQLRAALDKMCKVASSKSDAGPSHELKFKSKKDGVVIQAGNDINTMTMRYTFVGDSCESDSEMEFCIPATPLAQAVALLVGRKVTFTQSGRSILIATDTGGDEQEHSLMGMSPSGWVGRPVFDEVAASFSISRSVLCGINRFETFSCHADSAMAPITAIKVRIGKDGSVSATSTDQARISSFDVPDGCKDVEIESSSDDPEIESDDGVLDAYSFLLPPNAAAMMSNIFGPEHEWISVKVNDRRIALSGGPLTFDIDTEIGIGGYPMLRKRMEVEKSFSWVVDLIELRRIVSLVATIAMRTLCKVEFDKGGRIIASGVGGVERGSKSKQQIKPIEMNGDLFTTGDNSIEVSCADLVEALGVPTSDSISIGLSLTSNKNLGCLLAIHQSGDPEWNHMIVRSVEAT